MQHCAGFISADSGPNKEMWWLTCNDNTCTSGRRTVLNTPDDGRFRPKHVEWPYRNKTCTVLHQVGVSFWMRKGLEGRDLDRFRHKSRICRERLRKNHVRDGKECDLCTAVLSCSAGYQYRDLIVLWEKIIIHVVPYCWSYQLYCNSKWEREGLSLVGHHFISQLYSMCWGQCLASSSKR